MSDLVDFRRRIRIGELRTTEIIAHLQLMEQAQRDHSLIFECLQLHSWHLTAMTWPAFEYS